jgi:hypothetical protein
MGERAANGDVWPVAVLFGAVGASAAALGAWLAALASGATRPWFVLDWTAEHALWGTLAGALIAAVVHFGAPLDPALADAGRRRAAAARLATVCVGLGLVALAALVAGGRGGSWWRLVPELCGAAVGLALAWTLLARALGGRARAAGLPALDAPRTAVLLAVLTLPLAAGARRAPMDAPSTLAQLPASLPDAWQVMLGR